MRARSKIRLDMPSSLPYSCARIDPKREGAAIVSDINEKILKGMKEPSAGFSYLASRLRGEWFRTANALRGSRLELGANLRVSGRFRIRGPGRVSLGENVLVEGGAFNLNSLYTFAKDAEIRVGSFTFMNGLRVSCRERVDIGRWCVFADARVLDNDQHSVYPDRRSPDASIEVRPVVIEDNVWVCLAAIILKGVRIGRNSVIAAGAVVAEDIPPNCVAAGNPARVIRNFSADEIRRGEEFFAKRERPPR